MVLQRTQEAITRTVCFIIKKHPILATNNPHRQIQLQQLKQERQQQRKQQLQIHISERRFSCNMMIYSANHRKK
jgi:hypothetical protein